MPALWCRLPPGTLTLLGPGGIRTHDVLVALPLERPKSQTLYQAELRAQNGIYNGGINKLKEMGSAPLPAVVPNPLPWRIGRPYPWLALVWLSLPPVVALAAGLP